MNSDLEALATEAVSWMRAQSPETQSELYLSRSSDRALARREGTRDGVEIAESLGAGVRVIRDGWARATWLLVVADRFMIPWHLMR